MSDSPESTKTTAGLVALFSACGMVVCALAPLLLAQLPSKPLSPGTASIPELAHLFVACALAPLCLIVTLAAGVSATRRGDPLGRVSLFILVLATIGAFQALRSPRTKRALPREGPTDAECALRAHSNNPCPNAAPQLPSFKAK